MVVSGPLSTSQVISEIRDTTETLRRAGSLSGADKATLQNTLADLRTRLGQMSTVSGADVRDTQSLLKSLGFDPGPIDGQWGPQTQAAFDNYRRSAIPNWQPVAPQAPAAPPPPSGPATPQVSAPTTNVVGGGQSSPPSSPAPPAPPKDPEQTIRQDYGYMAWALDIPELHNLLLNAANEGWDQLRLKGALEATDWWKTHSSAQRDFIQQQKEDPATIQRKVDSQFSAIRSQANKLGINLSDARAREMATDSLRFGWSDQETQQAIANEFHYVASDPTANSNAVVQQIKQAANAYVVPLSDATIQQWAQQIGGGSATQEQFNAYLIQQAKSLFPQMANALDSGITTRQYAEPYAQVAAKDLEINPEDINFLDPKWMKALNQVDQKTGQRMAMNLSDWQQTIRTDPTYGYDQTQGARTQSADFSNQLLSMFGAKA